MANGNPPMVRWGAMGHGKEVGPGSFEPQPPHIDGDTDGRRHEGFGARIERVAAFGAERLGIALVGYLAMTQHDKAVEGRAGQRHEAVGEPGKCPRGYADALGRGSWQMRSEERRVGKECRSRW